MLKRQGTVELRKIFEENMLYDLDEFKDYCFDSRLDESTLIEYVAKKTINTPAILTNNQFLKYLKKPIFGEHQDVARKLNNDLNITKDLFFEIKKDTKKIEIILTKNKLTQIVKLSKLKSRLIQNCKLYNQEIEIIRKEFIELRDKTYKKISINIEDIQKELPFIKIDQTQETLHAIALLPDVKEKSSSYYQKIVKILSKLYWDNISLDEFIKLIYYLRNDAARSQFIRCAIRLEHLRPKGQKLFRNDLAPIQFTDNNFFEFMAAFAAVFDKYTNFLESILYKEGLDHDGWLTFIRLVKTRNKYPEINGILRKMAVKKLLLETQSTGYSQYGSTLVIEVLDEELVDLITNCGIHKIRNEEETEVVKQLKKIYYQPNVHSNPNISNIFKLTVASSFRHVTTLYYFLKIASIKGFDFFTHEMEFSDLRDLAQLAPESLQKLKSRKHICAVISNEDHNGAFSKSLKTLNALPKELFKLDLVFGNSVNRNNRPRNTNKLMKYFMHANQGPLRKMVYDIIEIGKKEKIDCLIIGAHGSSWSVDTFNTHLTKEAAHSALFKSIEKVLSKDAIIILISCSTGKVVNDVQPIAAEIKQALNRTVIAPSEDSSVESINYDSLGNITSVDYGYHRGEKVATAIFK